jgi:hypothetical protein
MEVSSLEKAYDDTESVRAAVVQQLEHIKRGAPKVQVIQSLGVTCIAAPVVPRENGTRRSLTAQPSGHQNVLRL